MKSFKLLFTLISILTITSVSNAVAADTLTLKDPFGENYPTINTIKEPELPVFNAYNLKNGEVLFSNSQKSINAINPNSVNNKIGAYFPGARGVNQLVIYTPEYGSRTNTNEFGAEAIVEGNTVSELSGADSLIPKNGIVISGHGNAKKWLNSSLKVGTKIYIDKQNNMIYAYTTSESYLYESEKKISEAEEMINYYRNVDSNYNWKVPHSYIDDAKNYLRKAEKNPLQIQKYSQMAIEAANDALKSVLPAKPNELKGVWIRPTETSAIEIQNTLNKLQTTGINNVFLETYFHGKTIYPSKVMRNYGFIIQNEKFQGFDPLRVWITEAHKRGIKVHIWFETFYVGNENPQNNSASILAQFPYWGNKTKKEADSIFASKSISEHNGYFIDPASGEVQDFLTKLLTEIILEYRPDGINLDYIRYPQAVAKNDNSSWGYTKVARDEFTSLYGTDPATLSRNDLLWSDWENYRRAKVTQFVQRASKLCKTYNTTLTAVIFPDRVSALSLKQQDWRTWTQNNLVDGFTPLFLTCDAKMMKNMMQDILNLKSNTTALYAGLFVTFMGGSDEDLIREIHEARKLDAKGVIIFDYAHLGDRYAKTLATSVFAPLGSQTIVSTNVSTQSPRRNDSSGKTKKKTFRFLKRKANK